jgi:hypothetical protein
LVNAALAGHMGFFMSTTWAYTVASRPGAGFVTAAHSASTAASLGLTTTALAATTLSASSAKDSVNHLFISLFDGSGAWKV